MSKFKSWLAIAGLVVGAVGVSLPAQAGLITVDFEQFASQEGLDTQLLAQGLTFSDALAVRGDGPNPDLDEQEFPPHSGHAVMVNNGAAITIRFSSDVRRVSFYATYDSGVVLEAFDRQGLRLGVVSSNATDNRGPAGNSGPQPNELMAFDAAAGDIAYVTVDSAMAGGVVVDDLSVDFVSGGGTVPEPQSLALVLAALAAGAAAARRRA